MKISEFSVVEFDALRNVSGKLAPRLSVIWGRNESGKTTLLRFFRRLLFTEPGWDGGSLPGSGTLLVRMNGGRNLKIELNERSKLIGELDGPMSAMPENFLPSNFETDLEIEAVADFMHSTKKLDDLERSLYSPNDPESSVNSLQAEIESNNLQIEYLQNQYPVYWELREALEKKREVLRNLRLALEKNRLSLAKAELIEKARPVWLLVRSLEEELTSFGPASEMPKRGLERLNELRERITDLRTHLSELRRKNAYESSRRRQMENNPIMTILKYGEALDDLEGEIERGVLPEVNVLAAEAAGAEKLLKRELMDIAPQWSEEDLTAADLSLAAERHGKKLCGTIRDFNERMKTLLDERAEAESKAAALQAEITSRHNNNTENPGELADYSNRFKVLQELRSDMLRHDALRWEIRGEKACADLVVNEVKSEGVPPPRAGNYMAKFFLVLLLSLSGVSAAVGIMAPVLRPYDIYTMLFCVSIALIPFFSILMSRKEHMARLVQWRSRYARRNGELDRIDKKISEHRQDIHLIDASIEQKAQILGLRVPFTLSDLDEAAMLLESGRRGAEDLEFRQTARKQISEDLEKSVAKLNELKQKLAGLTQEMNSALECWKNWLTQNRFTPDLTPDSFDSFLTAARAARADLKALNSMRRKLASQREYEASINARIRELNVKTGLELDREGLTAVFNSLKEARSLQARIEASLEDRRAVDFECSELEKELAAVVGSVRALCEEGGADSEEELRAIYEKNTMRSSQESRLTEAKLALGGIMGGGISGSGKLDLDEADFLTDGLPLAREAEALRLAIADGEKALTAFCGEVSALEEQVDSMVLDDKVFALRQRNEILNALVKKDFRRWLAVVLLKRFAEQAAGRNGKNMEPEIFKQTGCFLSLMAASGWKAVPNGQGAERGGCYLALERETDGLRLDETQWSSGLAGQAALSMKLSAAYCLAKRSEPVPVILDDVLTSFDEDRQKGAIEALWRASEKLQVILFTCHRSTADMFKSSLDGEKEFSVIEMPESKFNGSVKTRLKRGKKL